MPRFVSSSYPALMFWADGKKFKFAGGKLDVAEEDAGAVREFVAARGNYGILEVKGDDAPAEVPDAPDTNEPEKEPAPAEPENEVVSVGMIPPEAAAEDSAEAPVDEDPAAEQPNAEPLDGDIEDLTNRQLDELLEAKGLSKRGNHAEKVARLKGEE